MSKTRLYSFVTIALIISFSLPLLLGLKNEKHEESSEDSVNEIPDLLHTAIPDEQAVYNPNSISFIDGRIQLSSVTHESATPRG